MTGVIGLILAFIFGWKLTLVILSIMPVVVLGARMQMKVMVDSMSEGKEKFVKAGAIASEGIAGVRTVAAFNMQEKVHGMFVHHLADVTKRGVKGGLVSGFGFAFGHFTMFLAYFVAFTVAGIWVAEGSISGDEVLKVFFVLIFTSMSLGQTSSFAPNLALAKGAISFVFRLADSISEIDPFSEWGSTFSDARGAIELQSVHFSYPSRPHAPILRGVSLQAHPGQTVALVGASGSGKSTIIALLERFYSPAQGRVMFDGVDVRELSVRWLRKSMALVAQEPVLFDGTIYDNIAFGDPSLSRERVMKAAEDANAHSFVSQLQDGYETEVGERGTQLSGGQKQRIAIARAIVLEPKVLLLDEATSALDNESEKVVQAALDKVMKGRTTIVIAHRLSTIRNADNIYVFKRGIVVESGGHDQLVAQKGYYSRLTGGQNDMAEA
mmetsp:Transcript_25889/g.63896  ORF Transcript_25889/g.63896 Transcript_25889/m.63896 type:complete len:439 (+) Transcript_25889:619-1935(+)